MVNISEFEFLYYQMYLQDVLFNQNIDEIDLSVIPKSLIPNVIKMIFYEKRELLMNFPKFKQNVISVLRDNILQPGFTFEERQDFISLLKEIRQLFFDPKQLRRLYLRETIIRRITVNSRTKIGQCLHNDYVLFDILRKSENSQISSELEPSLKYLRTNYQTFKKK